MKILLTLIAFAIFNFSSAQVTISDDGLHFLTGAAISSGTYALVYSKTKNKKKAFWYSLGLSTLAGLSKEIYDGYIISGKFDASEAIATSLGGLTASYSFNIFTGKRRKKKKTEEAIAALRL
ncbi:hypothetical protein H8K90_07365 [Winogradskyella echinorum]|uniref:Uncharacterized protein n=1 Tax=Winogradskyella echinorum TaxID=538189 RepID=A0ABR6Y0B5_9FLAO|nr:hypothetical protein [Winogradskyella echinorum]MBC3846191.1 hypothetical protein [Winogradskyella echinorum]MBC5750539.1 hypothetical protein [Winogradskyella echinorum]